jgi:hypothetical protein
LEAFVGQSSAWPKKGGKAPLGLLSGHAQFFAPLFSSSCQNRPAVFGPHSLAKTVPSGSTLFFGLIRSFHLFLG